MAVFTIDWVGRLGGGEPPIEELPEGTTPGSYTKGDLLVFDVSELGVIQATVTTLNAIGVAVNDQVGTAQTLVPVYIPSPVDLFVATISAAGANSAAVHNQDNLGQTYGWIRSTETDQTDKNTVDQSNTANAWVIPIKLYNAANEPEGTAGGRVVFRFTTTAFDAGSIA